METTHNVTFIHMKPMTVDRFEFFLEHSAAFNKGRLREICSRLQVMATVNELKVPECFQWFEGEKTEEIIPKSWWHGEHKTVKCEYIIALHFPVELNEEEYRTWALILRGVNFGCNPYN